MVVGRTTVVAAREDADKDHRVVTNLNGRIRVMILSPVVRAPTGEAERAVDNLPAAVAVKEKHGRSTKSSEA